MVINIVKAMLNKFKYSKATIILPFAHYIPYFIYRINRYIATMGEGHSNGER